MYFPIEPFFFPLIFVRFFFIRFCFCWVWCGKVLRSVPRCTERSLARIYRRLQDTRLIVPVQDSLTANIPTIIPGNRHHLHLVCVFLYFVIFVRVSVSVMKVKVIKLVKISLFVRGITIIGLIIWHRSQGRGEYVIRYLFGGLGKHSEIID